MSTEFHEGDKVTFARGTSRIVAKVIRDRVCFESLPGSADLKWMTDMGWAVAWVEKAAPKLPTEPGWYESEAFPLGTEAGYEPYVLTTGGEWYTSDWKPLTPEDVRRQGKLHRLERESVTAKKVLAALRHRVGSIDSAYDFEAVAIQFGVE